MHVGEVRVTEQSVMTEHQGGKSTGCLPGDFSSAALTCAHRHGTAVLILFRHLPLGDLVVQSLPSPRPRSLRGAFAKLPVRASVCGLSPTALSPRLPSTSSWPRSPPHWWQLSSSETASEAAYASFAAAARRMSEGRLRPRSVAAALQSAPGGGGAGGSDKQDARPRPAPVTPLPGGYARQCRPAGTRSPTPWRWGWGACGPGQQKQA